MQHAVAVTLAEEQQPLDTPVERMHRQSLVALILFERCSSMFQAGLSQQHGNEQPDGSAEVLNAQHRSARSASRKERERREWEDREVA